MGTPLLILYLEGPLQSWGQRARWTYRDTGRFPTKSGVIGLLGCAMGLKRDDFKLLTLDRELHMGVRAERYGGELVDYHTVSGTIYTADGTQRGNKDKDSTIITRRQYLQDAIFMVVLEGPEEILQECAAALNNPVWTMYLGRKCCVPTRPVFERFTHEFESIDQALHKYLIDENKNCDAKFMCEVEVEEGGTQRQDGFLDNRARMFGYRTVKNFILKRE